jgi:hypothetical protein
MDLYRLVVMNPSTHLSIKVILILDLIAIFEVLNSTRSVTSKLLCKLVRKMNVSPAEHIKQTALLNRIPWVHIMND